MTEDLSFLELQVEEARAKLASDLALLRLPQTYREFGAELKSDAKSAVQRAIDDVKARAAANPSAALAIGAGLAWRLVKHPPIAIALIGAGVLSLWRTTPARINDDDYLGTAQQHLGEQVSDAAEAVKNYAAEQVVAAQKKSVLMPRLRGKGSKRSLPQQLSKPPKLSNRRARLPHIFPIKLWTLPNVQHASSAVLWPMKECVISSYWELPVWQSQRHWASFISGRTQDEVAA